MQISRMVLVCDVKIGQLGRKNLAVRFNLISDPPRLAANADGVEPNNPFDEIYEAPGGGEVRFSSQNRREGGHR